MENRDSQTAPQIQKQSERIKLPILAPLFISILVLLATFTLAIYNLQQQHITRDVLARVESAHRAFNQLLAADVRTLAAATAVLQNNPDIQNIWLAGNRQVLLNNTAPLLQQFHKDYHVTHIYFIDVNQTCFLRVHNPQRFGDRIDRFTLTSAMKTRKPAWGIELGPYGTFTLRLVQPWFVNNSLTGFIELGEEIEHITPEIKEALNVDLVVFIKKSLLTRQDWEEGQKMMGRSDDWGLSPDYVIADSTTAAIPPEFLKLAGLPQTIYKDQIYSSTSDGSAYRAGFIQLLDASGLEVGDILVIRNISKEQASLRALLTVIAVLCFLVAAMLVSFFYAHITKIEKHLLETHTTLITEIEKRKEAELELLKHRDHLEDVIKERTAQLEEINKQLQQQVAQRTKAEESLAKLNTDLEATVAKLIRSNRQLREFAHLASHDLKTPIRGIGTLAQWLVKDYHDKFDDNGRRQVNLLVKRAEQVDRIMNAILEYSTIVRNKSYERKVDLNALIRDAIIQVQPPKHIKVTVPENLPAVICEERHIHKVFYNLIENAAKFLNKADGLISIGCMEQETFWKFSISDNGPGIEPQYHERIFQLFQTLGDSDEVKGTGAGLTFVKKIVELYDGKVWLTSRKGRGTTFFFTWPKAGVAQQTPLPAAIYLV